MAFASRDTRSAVIIVVALCWTGCSHAAETEPWGLTTEVSRIVDEASETMRIAKFATLATRALDGTINARMIYPKPPNASIGESPSLHFVRFATSSQSRKFKELQANPNATLVYFDDAGKGEVTLKGVIRVCNSTEATQGWYDRWKANYPEGPATPFYTLLRFEATDLEFVSYVRYEVNEGSHRSDWRPLTLLRSLNGDWRYSPPLLKSQAVESI